MSTKLNQIIAVEKGIKSRSYSEISEINKLVQKPALFNGFSKTYKPKEEDADTYPAESQKVQETVANVLKRVQTSKTELFDVTAQKDFANMGATANVVVDGKTVVANAPVPYLLFLEKELTDVRTLVGNLPVLDSDEDWNADVNSGLFKTAATVKNSTKKVQKPIVLYNATKEHPAQTQMITEDVVVGTWEQIKQSGAMPRPEKEKLSERVEKLLNAVKYAREEANQQEAKKVSVGDALFGYLLN